MQKRNSEPLHHTTAAVAIVPEAPAELIRYSGAGGSCEARPHAHPCDAAQCGHRPAQGLNTQPAAAGLSTATQSGELLAPRTIAEDDRRLAEREQAVAEREQAVARREGDSERAGDHDRPGRRTDRTSPTLPW